jgi:Pyridoxamine 5'-phosphate oxidase
VRNQRLGLHRRGSQGDTDAVPDTHHAAAASLLSGPWDMATIERYLHATVIPVRLATSGRNGPLVQSMWFLWRDCRLWCATQDTAVVAHRLEADPRCAFEVAGDMPPYRGVRGQGIAELVRTDGRDVLTQLLHRYLGGTSSGLAQWLLSRADHEVAIAIRPEHISSWDFRSRMEE